MLSSHAFMRLGGFDIDRHMAFSAWTAHRIWNVGGTCMGKFGTLGPRRDSLTRLVVGCAAAVLLAVGTVGRTYSTRRSWMWRLVMMKGMMVMRNWSVES